MVEYQNANTKVKIICEKHGIFEIKPHSHLSKDGGCDKCRLEKLKKLYTWTTEIFIQKAIEKHGNKYDYSKVNYINKNNKIIIVCPIHGEFEQRPDVHLRGNACIKCGRISHSKKLFYTQDKFITLSNEKHNYFYDYSKVKYEYSQDKIIIICPIHGEFEQTATGHLNGSGCVKCHHLKNHERFAIKPEEFEHRAQQVHNYKYQYDLSTYKLITQKMKMICPIHGEFEQKPFIHLRGSGCLKCSTIASALKQTISIEEFLQRAPEIHNNIYDYSLVKNREFKNKKAKIICPIHGLFEQTFTNHLYGCGCPKCGTSHGEKIIIGLLDKYQIDYHYQYKFDDCVSPKNNQLIFDFFIPNLNLCIEFDGEQHFKPIHYFGGVRGFNIQMQYDKIKNDYCQINNIKLLRIKYNEVDNINSILNQYLKEDEYDN